MDLYCNKLVIYMYKTNILENGDTLKISFESSLFVFPTVNCGNMETSFMRISAVQSILFLGILFLFVSVGAGMGGVSGLMM